MFSKYQPVFGPETEMGSAEPADAGSPPEAPASEPAQHDGPGSGISSIKRDLQKGFDDFRKADEPAPKRQPRQRTGTADRVGSRLDMQDSGSVEPVQGEQVPPDDDVILDSAPPEGWDAAAKADWANTPDSVRAASLKREQDMAKGVKSIKDRYSEIDQALAPHLQNIQLHGHTPGAAINQLFSWFNALGTNPDVAFVALARSFGYDLRRAVAPMMGQQQQPQQRPAQTQQPAQGQATGNQPPQGFNQKLFEQRAAQYLQTQMAQQFQQRLTPYEQKIRALESTLQQQNQAKTEENLAYWAKDKPYYEDVREHMAYLVGSGAVPLKNGQVDLDEAYNKSIWAVDAVRNRMMEEQAAAKRTELKAKKEAESKAQREQADKARRAATSVPISAPGVPPLARAGNGKRGKSVRESLLEAKAFHETT